MLKAVLFDLDNTLVDRDGAFRDCVAAHFGDGAVRVELLGLDGNGRGERAALFESWRRHGGGEMNQARFGGLLAEQIRPDAELIEALRQLAREVKVGVITNGSGETQRGKFHAAGLGEVVSEKHLWISAEVGKAKPDPAIFLLASEALGELPEACLYIGDHEGDDLRGATAAGMRARLVSAPLDAERLGVLLREEGVR